LLTVDNHSSRESNAFKILIITPFASYSNFQYTSLLKTRLNAAEGSWRDAMSVRLGTKTDQDCVDEEEEEEEEAAY
jgi:hypothetical protein